MKVDSLFQNIGTHMPPPQKKIFFLKIQYGYKNAKVYADSKSVEELKIMLLKWVMGKKHWKKVLNRKNLIQQTLAWFFAYNFFSEHFL